MAPRPAYKKTTSGQLRNEIYSLVRDNGGNDAAWRIRKSQLVVMFYHQLGQLLPNTPIPDDQTVKENLAEKWLLHATSYIDTACNFQTNVPVWGLIIDISEGKIERDTELIPRNELEFQMFVAAVRAIRQWLSNGRSMAVKQI